MNALATCLALMMGVWIGLNLRAARERQKALFARLLTEAKAAAVLKTAQEHSDENLRRTLALADALSVATEALGVIKICRRKLNPVLIADEALQSCVQILNTPQQEAKQGEIRA